MPAGAVEFGCVFEAILVYALSLPLQGAPTGAPPRFEFPPGAVADRIAGLAPTVAAPPLVREFGAVDWLDPATFERWRAALATAAGATKPEREAAASVPAARAHLALLALAQGRTDDAWRGFEAAADEPEFAAALLPRFLPGIPIDASVGAGGLAGALPDGVVLTPATPPHTRAVERGRIERRAMRVRGLRVGDAVIGLRVAVEPEGVQIDVEHISGGPARIAVKLPTEPGFALANEYVDWFQVEQRGVAHVVEIRPGDEEHTLYGRFEASEEVPRFALPTAAPATVALGGIAILPEPGTAGRARAEALARALAGPPLSWTARVVDEADLASGWAVIRVDITDPRTSAGKIAALCGAIERFTLR